MLIELKKNSGVPIFRQIAEQVRHQILSGQLKEGEQITSVRELAKLIKVNPITISKAYSFLEQEQLVERRRGIGLFVAKQELRISKGTKIQILREALMEAAATAVQLGISERDAVRAFEQVFKNFE